MTATKPAAAPSTYVTGLCASGLHDRCRGAYAGAECTCAHHTEPEPEPEPAPAAPQSSPPPRRHCASCSCEDPR